MALIRTTEGSSGFFRTIARLVLTLVGVLAFGTLGYVVVEGWRPLDALFMAVITLTTIGYGEVQPLSDVGRVFTIGYILVGLGLATRGLSEFAGYVADGRLLEELRARRARREIQRMTSHFVVVGFGRLGREIVADLQHHGRPVVIVDRDALPAAAPPGITMISGDATLDETLRAAGVEHAQGLAVATPVDAINVYITLSARQLNPDLFIVTRCEEEAAAVKARRAGANGVIMPFHLGGGRMAQALLRPGASAFVDHAMQRHFDDLLLDDLVVTERSGLTGRFADLDVRGRHGVIVVAVQRRGHDRLVYPEPDTVIGAGDTLILVGEPEKVRAMVLRGGAA